MVSVSGAIGSQSRYWPP